MVFIVCLGSVLVKLWLKTLWKWFHTMKQEVCSIFQLERKSWARIDSKRETDVRKTKRKPKVKYLKNKYHFFCSWHYLYIYCSLSTKLVLHFTSFKPEIKPFVSTNCIQWDGVLWHLFYRYIYPPTYPSEVREIIKLCIIKVCT